MALSRSSPESDSKMVRSAGSLPSTQPFPARSAQRYLSPYSLNTASSCVSCIFLYVKLDKNNKLAALFETINLALSSPPLSRQILVESKVYLFLLTPSASTTARPALVGSRANQREKIAGCVIAQPIVTAMRIIESGDYAEAKTGNTEWDLVKDTTRRNSSAFRPPPSEEELITVDASTSLYCSPEPLPTPLGIPRMFVSSSFRRLGIASRLLAAAAENFIHGVTLDPARGEVAFTQPTTSGKALIEKWGKKGARIYRE